MIGKKWIIVMMAVLLGVMSAGCGTKKEEADGAITAVRFTYDKSHGDQVYLSVYVDEMSDQGAKAEITKRVGPMNYTGHKKEGVLTLNGEQVRTLLEILSRYDLEAWSKLPKKSSGSSPSRSLMVFSHGDAVCDVPWNTKFPETLPPQEDIMYAELFNFFNGMLSAKEEWKEVWSDNLEDPRDNPAYSERMVIWFGHEVKLKPGTGTWHEDGSYAEIDYEGKDWWIEEGFVGEWVLDKEKPASDYYPVNDASLTVNEDGSVVFTLDGEEWRGHVAAIRRYKDNTGFGIEKEDEARNCEVALSVPESYEEIHVSAYPGPVPEPQFTPIDVWLVKK